MKILENEIIGTQTSFSINFGGKLRFILSFFLSTSAIATYIFTTPTYTTTIIIFQPCALNVSFSISYQDLIKFPLWISLKERIGGERDHEDKVTLGIILLFCVS
jgi:hypothetical protein